MDRDATLQPCNPQATADVQTLAGPGIAIVHAIVTDASASAEGSPLRTMQHRLT